MKRTISFCFTIFLLSALSAQNDLLKTWYYIGFDGRADQRMTISTEQFTMERQVENANQEREWKLDKTSIVEALSEANDGYEVVGPNDEGSYNSGFMKLSKSGNELFVYQHGASLTTADQALSSMRSQAGKTLLSRTYFSEERVKEIDAAPSLDELTKEDLLKALNGIKAQEAALNELATSIPQRRIFQVVQAVLQRQLIGLGYNPWKITESYYIDRFKDDPDIKSIAASSIHIEF